MFTPKLLDRLSPKEQKEEVMIDVNLMDLPPPPIDENEPPPPPPPPPVEQPKGETGKFLPPKVKKDEEVPQESPPPTVEKLEVAIVPPETRRGDHKRTQPS